MTLIGTGLVDGQIPFVVRRLAVFELRCSIPVLPGGDGATTAPLEERTARCSHRTSLIVGQAPTCAHHIRAVLAQGWVAGWTAEFSDKCEP